VSIEGEWVGVVESREGLLVERFRACALWPVFEGIAGEVIASQVAAAERGNGTTTS